MINTINHYSIENTPTIYDEEALTALQLIARVTAKLNEVINAVNNGCGGTPTIPDYEPKPEEPEVKNDYAIVYPSGDISGVDDLAAIQDNVTTKKIVILAPGEYYLAAPIIADAGVTISGCGITNTVVHCAEGFITHETDNSIDHLTLRDVWVKGKGTGIAVNIARVNDEAETGGRYSYFENVRISEFSTGVDMTACWCVQFNHCRIEACSFGVIQGHTCNNITYNHCQFLGTNDSTGLYINSEGGAQSCGTHVVNCDFERHKIGVRAYCAVSLVIHNIYCEGTTDVMKLDSCPGFLCDGGYISFPGNLVLSTQRTNNLPFYANSSGVLKNIFVQFNSNNECYIMTASSAMPIKTENINVFNAGTGAVYTDSQFKFSKANGHENHIHFTEKIKQLWSDHVSAVGNYHLPKISAKNQQVKIIGAHYYFEKDFTPTETGTFNLHGLTNDLFAFTLTAGHSYKAGDRIKGEYVQTDYAKYILNHTGEAVIALWDDAAWLLYPPDNGYIEVEFAMGEMVCNGTGTNWNFNGNILQEVENRISGATAVTIPAGLYMGPNEDDYLIDDMGV